MDLGLGNLTELKTHLLNEGLRAHTRFDEPIAALGRGVAARFEAFCGRKFSRLVDDTAEFPAERAHVVLPRYPVEEISVVELRESLGTGWVDQGAVEDVVEQLYAAAGIAHLAAPQGTRLAQLRFTYTGGYWYPTSGIPTFKAGTITLATASEEADVTFSTPFGAVPFVFLRPRLPGTGALIECAPTAVRRGGFTATLGAPATAGLVVDWFAVAVSSRENGILLGAVPLAESTTEQAIQFDEAFETAPIVLCTVRLPADAAVIGCVPASVTASGFTAHFAAGLPSGAQLAWLALDPDTLLADDIGRLQGESLATAAAEEIAITFDTEFAEVPTVFAQLVTSDGTIIATAALEVSETGFTVALGAPAPAGSSLSWLALPATITDAQSLPAGATALPADLKLAWLLQCEHLWKLRDKLGTAVAGGDGGGSQLLGLTLAGANLVPEVERILRAYRRYVLT